MIRPALVIALLTCAVSATAAIDISFTPAALTSHTPLTAVVNGVAGSRCIPTRGTSAVNSATITLTIVPSPPLPCAAVITAWSVPVFIGTLAPGRYELVTTMSGDVLDRRSIVIADADPPIRIEENVGITAGHEGITIRRRDGTFCATCGGPAVTFDDVPAVHIETGTAEGFVVVTPPHAAGAVTVNVTFPDGPTYAAFGGFRYADLLGPADRAAYESILIPLVFTGDGAFGSQWTTDLWVHNNNDFAVTQRDGPFVVHVCIVGPCLQPIDPHTTLKYSYAFSAPFPHGRIMHVPHDGAGALQFGLRVRDLTRQREALGTEIPVVRERDLRAAPFSLFDISSDAQYRSKLRIYSLDTARSPVEIRLITMAFPFTQVAQQQITMSEPASITPAYAEVDLDPIILKLATPGPYRVEIVPPADDAAPSYWAFVTITNNQTQHVTVVTPH